MLSAQTAPFILTGGPASPARHHLTPPMRKSLKKTVRKVVHIVPVDGEGEESSRYLEAGKGGECS
jgi:hypothetical protein